MLIRLSKITKKHRLVVANVHVGAVVTNYVGGIRVEGDGLCLYLVVQIEDGIVDVACLPLSLASLRPWALHLTIEEGWIEPVEKYSSYEVANAKSGEQHHRCKS